MLWRRRKDTRRRINKVRDVPPFRAYRPPLTLRSLALANAMQENVEANALLRPDCVRSRQCLQPWTRFCSDCPSAKHSACWQACRLNGGDGHGFHSDYHAAVRTTTTKIGSPFPSLPRAKGRKPLFLCVLSVQLRNLHAAQSNRSSQRGRHRRRGLRWQGFVLGERERPSWRRFDDDRLPHGGLPHCSDGLLLHQQ